MARYTNEIAERRKVLLPLDELRQLFDDARQTVVELSGRRRIWTMHIPAQQDDPDILLTDALRQAHLLLVEVERLKQTCSPVHHNYQPTYKGGTTFVCSTCGHSWDMDR